MGKDLHNIDHLFRNAQKDFEEEPSCTVWERITYKLDHNHNETKREEKLFFGWKRVLFLMAFILIAFSLDRYKIKSLPLLNGQNILVDKSGKKNEVEIVDNNEVILPVPENISHKIPGWKNKYKISALKYPDLPDHEYFLSQYTTQNERLLNSLSEPLLLTDDVLPRKQKETHLNAIYKYEGLPWSGHTKAEILMNQSIENTPGRVQLIENKVAFTSSLNRVNGLSSGNRRKLALSFLISNDWGGYFINDEKLDRSGIPHDENEEISSREHHEESYSVSFFLSKYFSNKFVVKGGITYSNTAIGINPQYIYASKDPDGTLAYKYITSSGYDFVKPSFGNPLTIGDSLYSTEAKHKLKTISLQVMPGYTFRKNKFSITPAAGMLIGYIARASLKTEVEDNQHSEIIFVDRLAGSRKFYAGFVTDVSLAYSFTKKWSLLFIPSFRVNLSPVTTTDFIKTYPYTFSLGAGMNYSF